MTRLLAYTLVVIATFSAFGNACAAEAGKVYFRNGQHQFDPSFGENKLVMDSFTAKVSEALPNGNIERIVVRGYSSPDGTRSANDLIAHNRCAAIADYIAENTGISRKLIEENPIGIDWDELRRLVSENPDVPSRAKVIDILDNTPVLIFNSDGKIIDGRKNQLMGLQSGIPYNWMLVNLFPQMRNAVAIIYYTKEQPEPAKPVVINNQQDSSAIQEPPSESSSLPISIETAVEETVQAEDVPALTQYEYRPHHFAVKTNLLFDAALMPNLEFEWMANKDWSIGLEGDVAWWKFSETKVYRLAFISPEARYHFLSRKPWQGMYVGLFAGTGLYQLQNGHLGYHGEGLMGGLSFGYMWPIGRHFFFEAGIGAGYMSTRYKEYENREGHKVYLRKKTLNYFGPLKLKLSIAWRFDIMTKTVKGI